MTKADEITLMQVRLVRLATKTWGKNMFQIATLFSAHNVYSFIRAMYEEFHVQGDEANLEEIGILLKNKGVTL